MVVEEESCVAGSLAVGSLEVVGDCSPVEGNPVPGNSAVPRRPPVPGSSPVLRSFAVGRWIVRSVVVGR